MRDPRNKNRPPMAFLAPSYGPTEQGACARALYHRQNRIYSSELTEVGEAERLTLARRPHAMPQLLINPHFGWQGRHVQ
jgi:hypothetical protein